MLSLKPSPSFHLSGLSLLLSEERKKRPLFHESSVSAVRPAASALGRLSPTGRPAMNDFFGAEPNLSILLTRTPRESTKRRAE